MGSSFRIWDTTAWAIGWLYLNRLASIDVCKAEYHQSDVRLAYNVPTMVSMEEYDEVSMPALAGQLPHEYLS